MNTYSTESDKAIPPHKVNDIVISSPTRTQRAELSHNPNEPKPAYVTTNQPWVDRFIWLTVVAFVSFVIGFLSGQAHQQNIFEEAIEKARTQTIESHLNTPTTPREANVLHVAPNAQLLLQVVAIRDVPQQLHVKLSTKSVPYQLHNSSIMLDLNAPLNITEKVPTNR